MIQQIKKILALCLFSPLLFAETMATKPVELIIKPYTISVNGKTAQVYRIEQPDGTWGYRGIKGQNFNVIVKNQITEPTVLHWHGLIMPNAQDGVPFVTQPLITPGQSYDYNFKLVQSGTYWMHSHYEFQIQQMLSAPLIIEDPAEKKQPEVLMYLSDFSFKSPAAILNTLKAGMSTEHDMNKMMSMSDMGDDLVDVNYDALLTNYRTLDNPDSMSVKPGSTVRLRLINAGAATNFFINLGQLQGKVIAADGEAVKPLSGSRFTLALGQRLDILVTIPQGEHAYPILAQGEGTKLQTGLILATPKAVIPQLSQQANTTSGTVDISQEYRLKAKTPLPQRPVTQKLLVTLQGNMKTYVWTINGKQWPNYVPLLVENGQRVEVVFKNNNNMSHPMHLHGHVFEITAINGKPLADGALRDTVLIPANGSVTIQFDANNPGNWMIHCHILYHAQGGMMTLLNYKGIPLPDPAGLQMI